LVYRASKAFWDASRWRYGAQLVETDEIVQIETLADPIDCVTSIWPARR